MLSREENDLLTRVGSGTPMGDLFRRYWLPALLSEEIPAPDCDPVRVKLLGEDLVAFRDSDGKVGLLEEACAHRRASLFYGRNEECGLRCNYHGWKYDVDGNIVETPAEPAESMIRHHVQHRAYPCRDVNGLIYAYLGPKERMPLFPNYEWLTLPPDHVIVSKFINECNYLQALEGDIDNAHTTYLHAGNRKSQSGKYVDQGRSIALSHGGVLVRKKASSFELLETPWGVTCAAVAPVDEDRKYVHTNVFVMPCVTVIVPPTTPKDSEGQPDGVFVPYQVPADDYTTLRFNVRTRRSVPCNDEVLADVDTERATVDSRYRKIRNRANDYLIDRAKQRTELYSGIEGLNATQDACVTESMGPISDRTREHLGYTDTQIVAVRRLLLKAVRQVQAGGDPPGLARRPEDDITPAIRSLTVTIARQAAWQDLLKVK